MITVVVIEGILLGGIIIIGVGVVKIKKVQFGTGSCVKIENKISNS